jgi:Domain of unknown function (DUF4287)
MGKATAIRTQVVYSVHPSLASLQARVDNLPQTTGRSLKEWIALVEEKGTAGETEQREWLQATHGLGGATAGLIVELAQGEPRENTDGNAYLRAAAAYVDGMYQDAKAAPRPIHDALIELDSSMGEDVKICPCKTIVPLYRSHVFAESRNSR